MKIRMKDNSLRLRLTQSEVERFSSEGKGSSTTQIGPMPENDITYSLVKDPKEVLAKALFEANAISISVPEKMAADLAFTKMFGIEEHMPLETGETFFILVEKIRRLQGRPHEDESDAFPNPLEDQLC